MRRKARTKGYYVIVVDEYCMKQVEEYFNVIHTMLKTFCKFYEKYKRKTVPVEEIVSALQLIKKISYKIGYWIEETESDRWYISNSYVDGTIDDNNECEICDFEDTCMGECQLEKRNFPREVETNERQILIEDDEVKSRE